ncbi:hypothetical protein [Nonomuraea rubra]|uniref:Uncharacterized protein n=1 Tax=Nonomuraea rubra TaxID=46180 RepID=A0A7X0U5J7_9ACTN|nr:hypothetical protein [Nonomuraea rubra]MBB6556097.1 hypothetical protein [Nonomuraea rubra]
MAQPAFSTTLSPERLQAVQVTADAWRARGHVQEANNLLIVAGLAVPTQAPAALPPNVFSLNDFRTRRQAVSR